MTPIEVVYEQLDGNLIEARAKIEGLTIRVATLQKNVGDATASLVAATVRADELQGELEIEKTRSEDLAMRLHMALEATIQLRKRLVEKPEPPRPKQRRLVIVLRDVLVAMKRVVEGRPGPPGPPGPMGPAGSL
jgi:hypothetical protein